MNSAIMILVTLSSLLGIGFLLLLNGQTYTNTWVFISCMLACLVACLVARWPERKRTRYLVVALYVIGIIFGVGSLPWAFQYQQGFNNRKEDQKQEALELLRNVKTHGEFIEESSLDEIDDYLPIILFYLSTDQLQEFDPYLLVALTRQLSERPENVPFVRAEFDHIVDPSLKMYWGVMLVQSRNSNKRVEQYMRELLNNKESKNELREMLGPGWKVFVEYLQPHSELP